MVYTPCNFSIMIMSIPCNIVVPSLKSFPYTCINHTIIISNNHSANTWIGTLESFNRTLRITFEVAEVDSGGRVACAHPILPLYCCGLK